MRRRSVWKKLLGLQRAVVEEVELTDAGALVVSVRPAARERDRCPYCRRRCPGYDWGEGRRRWRALDFGTTFAYLEAEAPRVTCKQHGVVVAAVPWARHDSGFTRSFEDQVGWLAVQTSKTAVSQLMRIAWRTVGWICTRGTEVQTVTRDLMAGLKRVGIDEVSIRKGQRYLTVVVDHDTGRLVWAGPGREPQDGREVPGSAGQGPLPPAQARLLRHGHLDHRTRRRALPQRQRLLRSVSPHQALHRRAGRDRPRGVERGPPPVDAWLTWARRCRQAWFVKQAGDTTHVHAGDPKRIHSLATLIRLLIRASVQV